MEGRKGEGSEEETKNITHGHRQQHGEYQQGLGKGVINGDGRRCDLGGEHTI